ncbi:MAG: glycosyltransferase [Candidatus Aminicenantes bacterium]|nr:glycosyltransferase [Candidatus Aminicenantes bacterium]NIM81689.1 glycosyltransferase [Candidatus Aminicenantes bacterium]NIN21060.1 glycosyltransferase [Candidatus Aminicenantes bacterium]NIN44882.1 glycosyltransferase [Candidatus Aminicenantes bacterium]NIN87696.1 glycosyltransferase [Candidatus Aminicenantes bacterium]
MRIHLVTDRFHLGGGLEHIYQVAKGLKDIQFGIFAKPGTDFVYEKFSELKNVEICSKGYAPDMVMEKEPDLVHIHHLKPLAAFFKKPGKKYYIPILYTAHGLHIRKYEFYGSIIAKIKYFLRFQLEKRILPKARRIIAVSREDKHFLEEKYRLKNVTYLTNGIDFSAITPDSGSGESKAVLRKKLILPEDDFLFITVARFDFQKGYDILIKAIAKIKDTLERTKSNCRFVFVGDGSEYEDMKVLSQCLLVSQYILFLGARTDVYDILKAGDVFLLPSRWEGLPIVLLETGLLKVPVIASDTYGNREVIKEGNGILFKNLDVEALAQIIMEVLQNKYDLAAFAENLYKEIQTNYSLEKMLSGLREIYFSHR